MVTQDSCPCVANYPVLVRNPSTASSSSSEGTPELDTAAGPIPGRKPSPLEDSPADDTTARTAAPTRDTTCCITSGSRSLEIGGRVEEFLPHGGGQQTTGSVPAAPPPPRPRSTESEEEATTTTTPPQESELQIAILDFNNTLTNLRQALGSPAKSWYEKKLRALCFLSHPVHVLLLRYRHGTTEAPDLSAPSRDELAAHPLVGEDDARRLAATVRAAADGLAAVLERVRELGSLDRERAAAAEYERNYFPGQGGGSSYSGGYGSGYGYGYVDYSLYGSGAYDGGYNLLFVQQREAAQAFARQVDGAMKTIRKQTAPLREMLAKYGVEESDDRPDALCLVAPAMPMGNEEEIQPKSGGGGGPIARCVESIAAFLRDVRSQEAEEYDDGGVDYSNPCRGDWLRYQYLTRRFSVTRSWPEENKKKQLGYHKKAEHSFVDLQARLSEKQRSRPGASTGTGQLLLQHKIETRILLHGEMQDKRKYEGYVDEKAESSQAAHEERP